MKRNNAIKNRNTDKTLVKNMYSNDFEDYNNDIESFISNPSNLSNHTPNSIYNWLKISNYEVMPLSQGSLKNMNFEDGGGYKVNFNGDGLFQYHPPGKHHGGIAYYKISNGINGTKRYNLKGELIDE